MGEFAKDVSKFRETADRDGFTVAVDRSVSVLRGRALGRYSAFRNADGPQFVDVLFINGCDYSVPHPIRYRVDHQTQQLEAAGVTTARIDAWDLTLDMVGMARSFVIFRCPYTEAIGAFIRKAKELHKRVYFDIDDLVIDTRYTDLIPYLATMSEKERAVYDDGVRRMGRTLVECGSAITSTEALANELRRYVPEVFVNRNVASEDMLRYSEQALHERDVLPSLKEDQVPYAERHLWKWSCERAARRQGTVRIGYFSGSITHNDDFELVAPALIEVMRERPQVRLLVAGILDVPEALAEFADRVDTVAFCDWQRLPRLIASVDINIVPLAKSIFNAAKSENKWVEAALVKVATIASDFGAFARMVQDGETGVLCGDDVSAWKGALLRLVDDADERARIGATAYAWVCEHALSISSGHALAHHLRSRQTPNIFFALPDLSLSGGVLVALKHARIMADAGYDVGIITFGEQDTNAWVSVDGWDFPVRHLRSERNRDSKFLFHGRVDQFVATLWDTVVHVLSYSNMGRVSYLVQNYETDFYPPGDMRRVFANRTYELADVEYLTISGWCRDWLANRFGKQARFCPNGIDTSTFHPAPRSWDGRIRVLVEGDSESEYKNVDEAFRIVDLLDPSRYEIWYLSYRGEPKETYRVDHFLHKVPHDEVAAVYQQCHILLKTSWLESFSYPPLEMMATGGAVVVLPNEGNAEYVRDGENCLTYTRGDHAAAAAAIERIASDAALRAHLRKGGVATAAERDWVAIAPKVVELYR